MASARVEKILQEYAALTPGEQREFRQALPEVIPERKGSNFAAFAAADRLREEVRAYMLANNIPFTSASDLVHEVRRERDAEIAGVPVEDIPE